MTLRLDRRTFLNGVMAVAAFSLQAGAAVSAQGAGLVQRGSLRSMKYVGQAYLQSRPHEAGREMLLKELRRVMLTTNKPDAPPSGASPFAAGGEEVRALIRSDFAEGRTVSLDGWVLSETECRICALLAV